MKNFNAYPIFLSLFSQNALIIGFGPVGQRKLKKLKNSGLAKITVVEIKAFEELDREAQKLLLGDNIFYKTEKCSEETVEKAFIVFACSNDRDENARISEICQRKGKLCNNATEPEEGNFIVPASQVDELLSFAIATSGNSPALAALIKNRLAPQLKSYSDFSRFLGHARHVLQNYSDDAKFRQKILKLIVNSDFPDLFIAGNYDECTRWLENNISENIHLKLDQYLKLKQ